MTNATRLISNCCKAMLVAHITDEGTGHYTCSNCSEPCDQSYSRRQENVSSKVKGGESDRISL